MRSVRVTETLTKNYLTEALRCVLNVFPKLKKITFLVQILRTENNQDITERKLDIKQNIHRLMNQIKI